MQTKVGEPLVQSQLDADMRRLYGTGDFEHLNYRILEEPGKRVLAVDAVEKDWGPNYLRLGIGLSSDFSGATYFNVLASHRMTWLNSLGAELRTDVQLGFNNSLRMEFYQPLDVQGRYFIAPRVAVGQDQVNFYSGDQRVAIYNIGSRIAGLDLGTQFIQYGELRVGIEGGTIIPRLSTGSIVLGQSGTHYAQGGIRSVLRFDRLDNVNFPREGWAADLELYDSMTSLGAVDAFDKWQAKGSAAYSFNDGDDTARIELHGGREVRLQPFAGLRSVSVGWVPEAIGLRDRATGGSQSAIRPTGVLPPHRARRDLRRRLRRVVARSWEVRQSSGAGQSERCAEIDGPLCRLRQPRRAAVLRLRPGRGRAGQLLLLSRPADVSLPMNRQPTDRDV